MKYLAWLVAVLAIAIGVGGIVAPDRLFSLRLIAETQSGLLVIAVLRVAIGVVLIMTAPASRAPKVLQVVGGLVLLAGLATPLFGVERTKAVLDWEAAKGLWLVRAGAAVALAFGGFLAFVLSPRTRIG